MLDSKILSIIIKNLKNYNELTFLQTKFKKRAHFNEFMQDVHLRIHLAKKNRKEETGINKKSKPWDPIAPVAQQLASEAWLLCFDEFQVIYFKCYHNLTIALDFL